MALGQPLGLLALLGVPLLLALYFLRRKQPPRTVSALFLWRGPDTNAEAGPRLQRLSREASLLLELGAVLAAAAFLSDLRCSGRAPEPHAVFVVDSSLSMSARLPGGGSVAQAALERIREGARRGRVTVIASGLEPRVALGPAAEAGRAASLTFAPSAPAHDLARSLALGRELAGPDARVTLLTDAPLDPAPPGVQVIALGRRLDNAAFTAAQRRDEGGRARVWLRVAHFGASPAKVPVTLRDAEGKVLEQRVLDLGPGEEASLTLEAASLPALVAELPEDPLPQDGRATLLESPRQALKVALDLPDGPAADSVRRLLAADGDAAVGAPADLTFAAGDAPAGPWKVLVGAGGELKVTTGPYFPDKNDPLLDGVPLDGVVWAFGAAAPGRPLLTAGTVALVSQEPGPCFRFNVDLPRSNLHRSAAWPVMLANLLSLRREALAGFARRNLGLGEDLTVNLDAGARWSLSGPAGEVALRGSGTVRLPPPEAPGTYRLLRDGEKADQAVVHAIDPRESDLRDRSAGEQSTSLPVGTVSGDRDGRSLWPLALLAALLCADWALTGRRPAPAPARSSGRAPAP